MTHFEDLNGRNDPFLANLGVKLGSKRGPKLTPFLANLGVPGALKRGSKRGPLLRPFKAFLYL